MSVSPDDLERWISSPRFAVYLAAMGGDRERAASLYLWSASVSAALMEDFHHLEVLLRNRIDVVLSERTSLGAGWLNDPAVLTPEALKFVSQAQARLKRERTPSRDRTVAALSFGFWVALFDHRYERLWVQALHLAFRPDGPKLRKHLSARLSDLRLLRNRIAHHDSLQRVPLQKRHDEILELAHWLDPTAGAFLARSTRVAGLLKLHP